MSRADSVQTPSPDLAHIGWSSYSSLVKKVAVFGNAGGGKSRLARRLAELTGLPLYVVDMMQFRPGGAKVPHNEFLQAHAVIVKVSNTGGKL